MFYVYLIDFGSWEIKLKWRNLYIIILFRSSVRFPADWFCLSRFRPPIKWTKPERPTLGQKKRKKQKKRRDKRAEGGIGEAKPFPPVQPFCFTPRKRREKREEMSRAFLLLLTLCCIFFAGAFAQPGITVILESLTPASNATANDGSIVANVSGCVDSINWYKRVTVGMYCENDERNEEKNLDVRKEEKMWAKIFGGVGRKEKIKKGRMRGWS